MKRLPAVHAIAPPHLSPAAQPRPGACNVYACLLSLLRPHTSALPPLPALQFEYSQQLWPWSGYLAVYLRVKPEGAGFTGRASGEFKLTVVSPPAKGESQPRRSTVQVPLIADIIPTPPRCVLQGARSCSSSRFALLLCSVCSPCTAPFFSAHREIWRCPPAHLPTRRSFHLWLSRLHLLRPLAALLSPPCRALPPLWQGQASAVGSVPLHPVPTRLLPKR